MTAPAANRRPVRQRGIGRSGLGVDLRKNVIALRRSTLAAPGDGRAPMPKKHTEPELFPDHGFRRANCAGAFFHLLLNQALAKIDSGIV